jgi:Cell wall-active antibiotics response 4TMS YvqF
VRGAWLSLPVLLWAASASAQSMRPFSTFRQQHGETRLRANLQYAAGLLRVRPGQATELYRMDVAYDQDRFVPRSGFDASRGQVFLGVEPAGRGGLRVVSQSQLRQGAKIWFSPSVDLALDVGLGAVDADVDLGGLRLTELNLETGASRAIVRFSRPNGTRCQIAQLSAGAAELSVLSLGNSRCDRINFEGGVGKVVLDFGGTWTASSEVQVKMAMGELTLRLPRQVGVRLTLDKFLSSFQPSGLVRRGDSFESPAYDGVDRHLDIAVTSAVGQVRVEWADGSDR